MSALSCSSFTKLTTLAANATNYTNTGLAASTAYRYKVRAVRGSERSGYSGIATATTLPPLKTPSNVTGTVLTSTSLKLTWVDGNSTETGYEVWRCVGSSCTTFTKLTTLAANATTYTNTGLAASTAYRYKVRAVRGSERSGYSNVVTAMTLPASPSSLVAKAATSTKVNLTWKDNSKDESGFAVERCKGTTCTNFARIRTTAANAISFSDTTVAGKTAYRYRVRAVRGTGVSAASNIATVKTP
ncbi:fibronectin type III domain-containing protein [Candidatus Thiothrix anitrata]|uniref:Fibronectin type III domain-containing protein n=1 Tax=Candidatus Thiothrix anitrata TaxID=2823902 RepID=A0ABX7X351_9GAMM|nr:fibronectin type III domain-containing protein [Candidatus Thiothrix anitrata]QTR50332.1 fibronectin type III domain-containing protein [Candidatus Thiothrix anitrata]